MIFRLFICGLVMTMAVSAQEKPSTPPPDTTLVFPGEEKYLANVTQLTFGGQNAEAYFSHGNVENPLEKIELSYHFNHI